MHNHFLQAKPHCKTGSRTRVAVQLVARAFRSLTRSVGLEIFETAYLSYCIYDGRTTSLHVTMMRCDGFLPCSQKDSLHGVQSLVTTQNEVTNAA